MKALVCREFGNLESLHLAEIAAPAPKPGHVVIDVRAVTISFMDLLVLAGQYQVLPQVPFVPGGEAAGVVKAIGDGVSQFNPGDRVVCADWYGALAEEMQAHQNQVAHVPASVDFATASGVRQPYGTANYALFQRARLAKTDVVFVTGASGAVGSAAAELAALNGSKVIACVGDVEKAKFLTSRGLENVVNHRLDNIRNALKDLTDGRGPDVFLDVVGGELFEMVTRNMNWNGRILSVGYASGSIAKASPNVLLAKNLALHGIWFGHWAQHSASLSADADKQLFDGVAAGRLRPHIGTRFPFVEWRKAFDLLASRQQIGRIVIQVGSLSAPTEF